MAEPSVDVDIQFDEDPDVLDELTQARRKHSINESHLLDLAAHRLRIAQSHQELRSLAEIEDEIQLLEHQLDAAHRALFTNGGQAVFADEVGLGKTIEVGIVLKEMHFRDTHQTFLVLTPAQLATQWQTELEDKFGLDFACNYDDDFQGFDAHDKIVASIDTAKMGSRFDIVTARDWDVVVLDEAHYVRNDDTKRYDLIDALEYDAAFFATATPVQNDVTDLYNVLDLVRPGVLGTEQAFEQRYVVDGDEAQIKNAGQLQRKTREVMIRHKRSDTNIDFADRRVDTRTFNPSSNEQRLYEAVTSYVRDNYSSQGAQRLVLTTLQKEVVSSPSAVLGTVEMWLEDDAYDLRTSQRERLSEIEQVGNRISETTKLRNLKNIIKEAQRRVDKGRTIVFTQFRPTQNEIVEGLRGLDVPVHIVNGDYGSREKDRQVELFEEEGGVLVTTDSISEGRNMQFCNLLVNYDLPWNPMKVEQRIGRIDRIGQDREVYVFNLALEGTVEEKVLKKLYNKIDLFQQSVGDLKEILSKMEQSGTDFEQEVIETLVNANDRRELENNFEEMAVNLQENKEAAQKLQDFNRDVFDNFKFDEGGERA